MSPTYPAPAETALASPGGRDPRLRAELQDLARRWSIARRAAMPPASREVSSEAEAIRIALETDSEGTLRRVFEHGLALGEGFRRHYRRDLPLADLAFALPLLDAECLVRRFQYVDGEPALRGVRSGCAQADLHPRACEFWREATEGLLLGLTGAVRHARHRSRGAGDPECTDVLYIHPTSPLRFGPMPEPIREAAARVADRISGMDSHTRVEFLGFSEGVVYYRVHRSADAPSELAIDALIERTIERRCPGTTTRRLVSRPVLDPAQAAG